MACILIMYALLDRITIQTTLHSGYSYSESLKVSLHKIDQKGYNMASMRSMQIQGVLFMRPSSQVWTCSAVCTCKGMNSILKFAR